MGKLNIAHHKSYHPYRLDNIERVRRDEEEAKLKEAKEEGRMALADAEARIALLRERAGVNKKKSKKSDEIPVGNPALAPPPKLEISNSRHINLFEDLEQQAMSSAIGSTQRLQQKAKESNDEKGVALAPSQKDRNPWYTARKPGHEVPESDPNDPEFIKENERRARDLSHKSFNDPLREVNSYLSRREQMKQDQNRLFKKPYQKSAPLPNTSASGSASSSDKGPLQSRLSREKSERERALELINRKKREAVGMDTPVSSVDGEGYRDVFNRRETEDARRSWRRDYRVRDHRSSVRWS